MSWHNCCVSCGEYCNEDEMICVNCQEKIRNIRSNASLDIHMIYTHDDKVAIIDRGEIVGSYSTVLEALAELLRRYGRG